MSSAVSLANTQDYSNTSNVQNVNDDTKLNNNGSNSKNGTNGTTTTPPPPPPPQQLNLILNPAVPALNTTNIALSGPVDALADQQSVLRGQMRKLWSDHVFWTRQHIVSTLANLPDTQAISDRLMKNQEDLGNAVKPYFGNAAGDRLTDLLKQHISSAVELVAAIKANDSTRFDAAKAKAQQNVQDLATLLNQTDSALNKDELVSMLTQHVQGLIDETSHRMNQRWAEDVNNFDALYHQALMMADALTNAIIKKFPDRFPAPAATSVPSVTAPPAPTPAPAQ